MSSQVMEEEAAAAGCSEAAAELATEEAAELLAALLEQPDSAPAAAAPRALRADARMKFLREILFIVRESFPFFFFFQSVSALRSLTLFDDIIIVKFSPKEKFNFRFSVMYFFYKFIDLPQRFCYNGGNAGKEARFA